MGVSGGTTQEEKRGGERVEEESECFWLETKRRQGGHSDSALLTRSSPSGGGGRPAPQHRCPIPTQLQVGTGLTLPLQTPCALWGPIASPQGRHHLPILGIPKERSPWAHPHPGFSHSCADPAAPRHPPSWPTGPVSWRAAGT